VQAGSWKAGKRDGFGTYNYPNGDIYRGIWADDKQDGDGTYYFNASMSQVDFVDPKNAHQNNSFDLYGYISLRSQSAPFER
jgi:hypothetical protein